MGLEIGEECYIYIYISLYVCMCVCASPKGILKTDLFPKKFQQKINMSRT